MLKYFRSAAVSLMLFCTSTITYANIQNYDPDVLEAEWGLTDVAGAIVLTNQKTQTAMVEVNVNNEVVVNGKSMPADPASVYCNTELFVLMPGETKLCRLEKKQRVRIFIRVRDFHNGSTGKAVFIWEGQPIMLNGFQGIQQ